MSELRLIQDRKEMEALLPTHWNIFENPFGFTIDGELAVVGELEMYNSKTGVYIKNICSIEMGKGYGRIFIQFLKEQLGVKEIIGEAIPDAVPFWHRMGAKFNKSLFDEYIHTEDHLLDSH